MVIPSNLLSSLPVISWALRIVWCWQFHVVQFIDMFKQCSASGHYHLRQLLWPSPSKDRHSCRTLLDLLLHYTAWPICNGFWYNLLFHVLSCIYHFLNESCRPSGRFFTLDAFGVFYSSLWLPFWGNLIVKPELMLFCFCDLDVIFWKDVCSPQQHSLSWLAIPLPLCFDSLKAC